MPISYELQLEELRRENEELRQQLLQYKNDVGCTCLLKRKPDLVDRDDVIKRRKIKSSQKSSKSIVSDEEKVIDEKQAVNFTDEKFEVFKQSLLVHFQLYGHMQVKSAFIIPKDSPDWPENTWGYYLGRVCDSVRRHEGFYLTHKGQLEEIGFDCTKLKDISFSLIRLGLLKYLEIYGDLLVPKTFDVPHDPSWPQEKSGLRGCECQDGCDRDNRE